MSRPPLFLKELPLYARKAVVAAEFAQFVPPGALDGSLASLERLAEGLRTSGLPEAMRERSLTKQDERTLLAGFGVYIGQVWVTQLGGAWHLPNPNIVGAKVEIEGRQVDPFQTVWEFLQGRLLGLLPPLTPPEPPAGI